MVHDKGIGVVAVRPIPRGTLILQEVPLFLLDEAHGITAESVKGAVDMLDKDKQKEFLALKNSRRGEMNTLLGIFKTNALPCATPKYIPSSSKKIKPKTYGIFPEAARFNSSCSPNVSSVWNRKLSVIRLFTIRDVGVGEELSIAYDQIPLLGTREERWSVTEEKYGFRCECLLCESSGKELLESDKRRTELKMRQKGAKFIFSDPVAGLRLLRGAFESLEQEGLHILIEGFALDAYQICVELEKYDHGYAYLSQAYEMAVVRSGPDSDQAERLKAEMEEAASWLE